MEEAVEKMELSSSNRGEWSWLMASTSWGRSGLAGVARVRSAGWRSASAPGEACSEKAGIAFIIIVIAIDMVSKGH